MTASPIYDGNSDNDLSFDLEPEHDGENFVKTVRFSTNSKNCQMAVLTFSNVMI